MPIPKSKKYALISQRLERMADGVVLHLKEENFPPSLKKEKELRDKRGNLENLRQSYEELQTKARVAYDEYAALAEKLEVELSKAESLLYGFYGKRSEVLKDFGLQPWKKGGKKGPRKKEG